jgi:hypothetical protein
MEVCKQKKEKEEEKQRNQRRLRIMDFVMKNVQSAR